MPVSAKTHYWLEATTKWGAKWFLAIALAISQKVFDKIPIHRHNRDRL
ncbi:MAG: hypothetical protein NW220_18870 [Leptolyngbyaceae cyanobacterium bins.349]|nr:hypothetical protein [Leptolyngbyaceae cyanobacterium bins.349]